MTSVERPAQALANGTGPPRASPSAAAIDLTRHIRPGDTVVWGQACAEPLSLTRRLADQLAMIGPLRCFLGASSGVGLALAGTDDLTFVAYCGAGANRALDRAGRLEILPSRYSDLPGLFATGALRVDVALVQVTPGDNRDTFRFTLAAEYLVAAARAARVVIAEVNEGAPHSPDAPALHAADVDVTVTASYLPAEHYTPSPTAAERRIAEHVASLVEDGATLQMGLGSLPEAIVGRLTDRTDLGIHSGTIGDAAAQLMQTGVITNARKTRDRGTTVCGLLMGTSRLFEFADQNPAIALRETSYTHDPAVLSEQPKLVAVNSAVEVDLTGQVNSEVAASRYVGAVGGALDFIRGAHRSRGGLPIIALTSTAGTASRIVAKLSGPVTLPRSEAAIIVTEHGTADLRGLTISQRREQLLAIAHPDHRAQLDASGAGPGERRPTYLEQPT
jgi:acyl-CoA hydrolase